MLGKQGWRLLTRPDLLCAKVLKGKYFPTGDFLSATKKRWSSATWRSILHGRDVLQQSLIKQVGPGDINVWQDNWIPGLRSLKPPVRMPSADAVLVCDLFVPGTRVWDERVVHKSSMALDAMDVLKIKQSARLEEDVVAWALEKNGLYSVHSAYRLLKEDQAANARANGNETSALDDSHS